MADESFEVLLRVNLDAGNLSGQLSNELGRVKGQYSAFDGEIQKVQNSLNGAGDAQKRLTQNLSTTRYALYDVSSTLAIAGGALLGLSVASSAVSIAWERDFANVVRTNQLTSDSIDSMHESLRDIAQTMPIAFGDVTQIATLAGQVGIAEDNVVSFTETIAKFAAISDVSVEAAATAFGRMDSLLPDVNGNFEALGSSIARVAVNSASTESQIISIATQISGVASIAGITSAEVVGLSGALASVGTAPELSRGTVTRLFTEMREAIQEGGERLELFGKIAGVSGQEFRNAFGTEAFGPILEQFILGLGDVERTGGDAAAALDELGITSVRDVPALLRLASASDVVSQSFANARSGFAEANELNAQYGIIAETTAAKLKILANNFQAFLAALGGATLGPIGDIADILSKILDVATDIISTPFGSTIAGWALVFAGLLGVLALVGGGLALFGASMIGMQQGLSGIAAIAPRATAALLGTGNAAALSAGGMSAAATSARILGTALKAISIVTLVAALPSLADAFNDTVNQMSGAATTAEGQISAAFKDIDGSMNQAFVQGMTKSTAAFARNAANIGLAGYDMNRRLKEIDETISGMARGGDMSGAIAAWEDLRGRWKAAGGDVSALKAYMVDTMSALRGATSGVEQAAAPSAQALSNMNGTIRGIAADAESAAAALDALRQAVLNIGNANISAEQAAINVARAFNAMQEAAGQADVTINGTNESSLRYRETLVGMELAARESALAMIENGASVDQATSAYNNSRQAIIDSIAAKTGDIATATVWADTILGSASEAGGAIAAYAEEVNAVPDTANTDLTHNGPAAGQSLRGYINEVESVPETEDTNLTHNGPAAGQSMRAYINEVESVPPGKDTALTNNAASAGGAVRGYIATLDAIPRYISTSVVTHYSSTGTPQTIRNPATYRLATGGPIYGPGSGTSDSIPIWASNGEYMVTSRAHGYYGTAFMNAINSLKMPKFADGGPITATVAGSGITTGIMELGPKSLAALSQQVINNIILDDVSLSRAVQRGNAKRRLSGDFNG